MYKIILAVCVTLALTWPAAAQGIEDDHKKPDKVFRAGLVTLIAAHGADLWSTGKCVGAQTCREANYFLRPFESSSFAFGAVKMAAAGGQVLLLEQIHKRNKKLARVTTFALAGATFAVAVRNGKTHRR